MTVIQLQKPIESPVFIGKPANENFTADELPTAIPPDKAAMRLEIERLTVGHAVTICPPRKARTGIKPWKPARAANDNQAPLSWPLAEALRRSGKETDIEICEIYRGLYSVMSASPLQGKDVEMASEDNENDLRIEVRSGKLTEAKTEIDYHEVRETARTPGISTKATNKGEGTAGERYIATTAHFNETTLITQIDMRGAWARLRAAIRPLLAAFEDACLDGLTFTEIGEVRGFKDKQASAAGRALVFEAIGALSEEWVDIRREARELEQQADRNVLRFRAKRERAMSDYLGVAA
ncbi:hypothetical protein [Devosia aquimaris]|uniref:hypothetical protein n=1 Tax=Devosia aquimaris TaxID=2866214 RepID=UPI001CD067AA|nr:hypothetical protein [Devosia sp. CJK-A8-3]